MSKKIDLIGQRFGMLTVIAETEQRDSNGSIRWLCRCDCGRQFVCNGPSLRNGHTTSCGCKAKYKDLIGQRFGNLVVISLFSTGGHERHAKWKCKCDCGCEVVVASRFLISGEVKSCGCICSRGEEKIIKMLSEHQVHFKHDKEDGYIKEQTGRALRFDFIIYNDNNTINRYIEYDGIQHYKGWDNDKESYELIHERDLIKNKYCLDNNIPLVRIPYTDFNVFTYEDLFSNKYLVTSNN